MYRPKHVESTCREINSLHIDVLVRVKTPVMSQICTVGCHWNPPASCEVTREVVVYGQDGGDPATYCVFAEFFNV